MVNGTDMFVSTLDTPFADAVRFGLDSTASSFSDAYSRPNSSDLSFFKPGLVQFNRDLTYNLSKVLPSE